ncbi:MAG: hypothetical protein LH628_25945, partial [Microcoleus sp. CAN_BIN18]|nr:hypothetical protein [Microcoleus sp. CAN_BIN18]
PIFHIRLTLVSPQPLFPLTIRSISTISKGDDCTEDVKRSYPVGRSPQQTKARSPSAIQYQCSDREVRLCKLSF